MQLTAIIEMPHGTFSKLEVNKNSKRLKLDRLLNQPVPYHYGFVEDTLEKDGDPIDIFVLADANVLIPPLTEVTTEIIGVLKCLDNGVQDNKLIGILAGKDIGWEEMGVAVIKNYLETYKTGFEILGYGDKDEAIQIYNESVNYYSEVKNRS